MSKPLADSFSFGHIFKTSGFTDKTALILSVWFGAGLIPFAPGTFGTLGALPVVLWMQAQAAGIRCAVAAAGVAAAVWAAGRARDRMGEKDPSRVVIDEVAGYLTAMAFLPRTWAAAALGFFLFRLFDIWKPFPVRRMERLPGGLGIVMDDVVAGVYTLLSAKALLVVSEAFGP